MAGDYNKRNTFLSAAFVVSVFGILTAGAGFVLAETKEIRQLAETKLAAAQAEVRRAEAELKAEQAELAATLAALFTFRIEYPINSRR